MTQVASTTAAAEPKNETTFGRLLRQKRQSIVDVCSPNTTPETVTRLALLAENQVEHLRECDQASVLKCVMDAAALGIEFNTPRQHAWLIPRRAGSGYVCSLMIGYRGYLSMCYQSSLVEQVDTQVVYKGDAFKCQFGTIPEIHHVPGVDDRDDADITHAYAILWLRGARFPLFEVMTRRELDKVAKAGNSGGPAYKAWLSEMFRKAPLRRLLKRSPLSGESPELGTASMVEDDTGAGLTGTADGTQQTAFTGSASLAEAIDDLPVSPDAAEFAAEMGAMIDKG